MFSTINAERCAPECNRAAVSLQGACGNKRVGPVHPADFAQLTAHVTEIRKANEPGGCYVHGDKV